MNCQDISRAMDDRDIGALGEAGRREFDAHLAACADCARDFDVHVRLAATPTPPLPADLERRIRMSLLVPAAGAGGHRASKRLVVIGAVVAFAAAAAMFAVHSVRTPTTVPALAATVVAPVALPVPVPVSVPESVETIVTAAPVAALPVQPRAAEAESPPAQPMPAEKLRTVRVLPLQNQATGAAFTAVDSFFAAFIDNLRGNHELAVLAPDQAEPATAAPAEVRVRVRGFGPVPEGKFTVEVTFENLQSDGSYKLQMIATPTGDIAPACAGSPPFNGMASCRSPSHLAGGTAPFVLGLLPPDPSLQRDPRARLLDKSLSPGVRLDALYELRDKRNDPEVVRGAIDFATTATEPRLRAEVWRAMLNVRNPELVPPLVEALRRDPDADVRLQAMTTLAVDYAEDPRVSAAFDATAQMDSKPLLRALAQRRITGYETWKQYIVASLKDTSRSDAERVEALLFGLGERLPPLDPQLFLHDSDAIAALTEVLRRMESSSAGGNLPLLINRLSAIDDPAITDLVLRSLEKRSAFATLSTLRGMLANHRDDSPIRAVLEKISVGDPDPNIRQAAAGMLKGP
jgi:hypothetical protein